MHLISHRRNTIDALRTTPERYGVEVDIRSFGERLIIHHDPYCDGEDFVKWVENYRHGTLILNVKEEGLEARLVEIMAEHSIEDFFFLDQSFPFLLRSAKNNEPRCAARVSEYEAVETALSLGGQINWIWVDCFSKFPLTRDDYDRLKAAGFKLCLVSPELQGRDPETGIRALNQILNELNIVMDAVCTKRMDLWETFAT